LGLLSRVTFSRWLEHWRVLLAVMRNDPVQPGWTGLFDGCAAKRTVKIAIYVLDMRASGRSTGL